jgi:hypothetical protein
MTPSFGLMFAIIPNEGVVPCSARAAAPAAVGLVPVAGRAGPSVAVLLTAYSHRVHGHDDLLNQQIGHVLRLPAGRGPCPSVEASGCTDRATLRGCLLTCGSRVRILPGAQCDVSRHRGHREPTLGPRCFVWPAGWPAGGLVVPGGVDGELAQELAGGCVDDPDVQVLDEHQDAGPGVGPADADVMQAAAGAQGELAVGVDAVGRGPGRGCRRSDRRDVLWAGWHKRWPGWPGAAGNGAAAGCCRRW